MPFDIARTRAAYPALTEGFVHFDGAGGTQTAQPVIDAVADAMGVRWATAAPRSRPAGGRWRSWRRPRAVADLVGADRRGWCSGRVPPR